MIKNKQKLIKTDENSPKTPQKQQKWLNNKIYCLKGTSQENLRKIGVKTGEKRVYGGYVSKLIT